MTFSAMRIVAAPDSFKESMTARVAAEAIRDGALDAGLGASQVVLVPLSDGGEGLLDVLVGVGDFDVQTMTVPNALGEPVVARWLLEGRRAVIEVAQAVGLADIPMGRRDIMASDTTGVGELVLAALDAGCCEIVLGLGGTATNDGGAGMLAALGARFVDEAGAALGTTPAALLAGGAVGMDLAGLDARLAQARVVVASDVTAPLVGALGASATFGPQKGATPQQVAELDGLLAGLARAAGVAGADVAGRPGAGAAGGLGWALMLVGADLGPGFELVAGLTGLGELVSGADLVITGEGSFDEQSLRGKVVQGVAGLCRAAGVECQVFAGRVDLADGDALRKAGITGVTGITPAGQPFAEALSAGPVNLRRAVAGFLRH
ncbi:glycerate kinase [Propionibacteriaceae bacterium G1746]|uniref:glycerate kinase family protein n=1 Tax=Aestuariimicrobium sp. G57 TaxID=3418485 RepID=UPI003C16F30E